jgi:hypothetical protein
MQLVIVQTTLEISGSAALAETLSTQALINATVQKTLFELYAFAIVNV